MDIPKKQIQNITKLIRPVKEVENEKLFHLSNEIEQEFITLAGSYPNDRDLALIKEKFTDIKDRIQKMIRKETDFIWPYISKLVDKRARGEQDSFLFYKNLGKPLETLILEQGRLMEKCEALKFISHNYINLKDNDLEYRKTLTKLFDLYQLVEKHIYLEEYIILPALVYLFESPALGNTSVKKHEHV